MEEGRELRSFGASESGTGPYLCPDRHVVVGPEVEYELYW